VVLGILLLVANPSTSAGITPPADSASIAIPENMSGALEIGTSMQFVKDSDHQLTIETILASSLNWAAIDRKSPNFGFTEAAYWFLIPLTNQSGKVQEVLLELPIPFLDNINLYQVTQGNVVQSYHLGDSLPFAQRPLQHPNFIMPLELAPGDNTLYLRVASSGTVEVPLNLWNTHSFMLASSDMHLFEGIWAGMIAIMVVYNFLLFFSIREPGYLYYSGFALSYLLFQLSLSGYAFAYLWSDSMRWNSHAIPTSIALSLMFTALLTTTFLQLKQASPIWHRILMGVAVFMGLVAIATFFAPYTLTVRITSLCTILMCALAPMLSFRAWLKGDKYARYFCVGWSAAFSGIMLLVLNKFGLVPVNFITSNAGHLGMVLMMALLSLALADRFNREREMRIQAQEESLLSEKRLRRSQEELLATKEDANQQLELKVRERTQTMQKALLDLEQANQRLELLSTTDALTTLFNRGYFEARVDIEFKRALRHQRDISIIICDVDLFKSINDRFGHKAGDQCLRSFALTMKNKIIRSGDLIARYGGEEFIIMLVDTPLHDAEYIANALCAEVRNIPLMSDKKTIAVTASFGVASLKQSNARTAEDLIHRADMALYQAKNEGRDRVVLWHKIKENTLV
jgi:diguanylate cyclase (GGDEF)-like protein